MVLLAVGTFNTDELFTIRFDPSDESLELLNVSPARGNHSWLSTAALPSSTASQTPDHPTSGHPTHLYATCWTEPPSVAAYRICRDTAGGATFELINTAETTARSGYVYVGFPKHSANPVLYTVGGPTGEVVGIDAETGGFDLGGAKHSRTIPSSSQTDPKTGVGASGRIQELDFVTGDCSLPGKTLKQTKQLRESSKSSDAAGTSSHGDTSKLDGSGGKNAMDFGGLRHGSHGIDLSPDGSICYVPDIGRNCVWTYDVDPNNGALSLAEKSLAPRSNDGPRHTISHPGGKYIYSLQEHSSMVDIFQVHKGDGAQLTRLEWKKGVKIIPQTDDVGLYWADEVRLSCPFPHPDGAYSRYLFASTRGLASGTKGWVAVFELDREGMIVSPDQSTRRDPELGDALDLYQTPTSGGWANAIEPAPRLFPSPSSRSGDGQLVQYAALTDSEEGVVRMLCLSAPPEDEAQLTERAPRVKIEQVASLSLGNHPEGQIRAAATAVWI